MTRSALIPALVVAAIASGCNPTYSPPAFSTHYGAPGRLDPGQGEILGAIGSARDGTGTVLGGIPIGESTIEPALHASRQFGMASVGLRMPLKGKRGAEGGAWLGADLAFGGAIGLGGERCGNLEPSPDPSMPVGCDGDDQPDGRDWNDRFAVGGYLSPGLSLHLDWFVPFVRVTLQVSKTTGAPVTLWSSLMVGVELEISDHVRTYGGIAGWFFANSADSEGQALIELGLSVPIGS